MIEEAAAQELAAVTESEAEAAAAAAAADAADAEEEEDEDEDEGLGAGVWIAITGAVLALFSGGGLDLSDNLLTVLPPGVVSGFETYEIFWEKRPDLKRDGDGSTFKLDLSGNPLR